MEFFDNVESTNTMAKELLVQGETEGLIVTAKTQTAGRGRKGRSWLSPIGGLYFSILLKPRLSTKNTPLVGLLSSCAVVKSISALGIEGVQVKWPNDVLIQQYKVAGILSEAVSINDELIGVVVGIGVNQNCSVSDLVGDLQWPATSIIDVIGEETSNMTLLCSIVNEIDALLNTVETEQSFDTVLNEWRRVSATLGGQVRIHETGKTIDGIARDIDSDGALLIETDEGLLKVLYGDISHIRSDLEDQSDGVI